MNDKGATFANIGLRLASLGGKLGLSLYMGRYFSLSDIGAYGLIFGIVMAANTIMGMRIDYVVSRDIVGLSAHGTLRKMRDQAVFYFLNYAGLIGVALLAVAAGRANGQVVFFVTALTMIESFANMMASNMNSMEQPVLSNALFFLRSGLWAVIVAGIGIWCPAWRTLHVVLSAWMLGDGLCIALGFVIWRHLPWRDVLRLPVDWGWIRKSVRKCFPLWIGAVGLAIGATIDRFVVDHFLGLDQVGVLTFYLSFTGALLALVQSGMLPFFYPRLILLHRDQDEAGFHREARIMARQVALFSTLTALAIGATVYGIALWLGRASFIEKAAVLWLILFGSWIRTNAETLYIVLFARHQDREIWLGNLLFLVVAVGGNAVLVPALGLAGSGYAAIMSGLFLFFWRLHGVRNR